MARTVNRKAPIGAGTFVDRAIALRRECRSAEADAVAAIRSRYEAREQALLERVAEADRPKALAMLRALLLAEREAEATAELPDVRETAEREHGPDSEPPKRMVGAERDS